MVIKYIKQKQMWTICLELLSIFKIYLFTYLQEAVWSKTGSFQDGGLTSCFIMKEDQDKEPISDASVFLFLLAAFIWMMIQLSYLDLWHNQ